LKNTPQTHLKSIATIRKHPNKTHATYVYNIFNIQINTIEKYIWKTQTKTTAEIFITLENILLQHAFKIIET